MTILWAGTSVADLEILGSAVVDTIATDISPNVNEGILISGDSPAFTPRFSPQTDLWTSFVYVGGSMFSGTSKNVFTFNSPNFNKMLSIRIVRVSTTTFTFAIDKRNGTAWVELANNPSIVYASNVKLRFDVHIKVGSSGLFEVFINGTSILRFTGDTVPTGAGAVGCYSLERIGNNGAHSAMIIADTDTRALTFYQRLPTGNGAETSWTGDYASVDETGINDTDFIKAVAVGNFETFTFPALPVDVNAQQLEALVLVGRSRNAGDIQEIKGVARVGSTNHEAPAQYDARPSFGPQLWVFPTNPATGQPWIGSEINSAQFGVRAT